MNLRVRIGRFFLIIGLLVIFLFIATFLAGAPIFEFLMAGVIGVILGLALMVRGRSPPAGSERFRTVRSARRKMAREEKKKG